MFFMSSEVEPWRVRRMREVVAMLGEKYPKAPENIDFMADYKGDLIVVFGGLKYNKMWARFIRKSWAGMGEISENVVIYKAYEQE